MSDHIVPWFDVFLAEQRDLQELIQERKYARSLQDVVDSPELRNQALKDCVLGIISEACEFLDHLNWKQHKRDHPIDESKRLEELVDLFKYALNLHVYLSVDRDEFINMFIIKSRIVRERLDKEFPENDMTPDR